MADVLLVGWFEDWLFDVWLLTLELLPDWSPLQRVETIGAVEWLGRDGTNLGLGIRMGCISSQASIVELWIYLTFNSKNFFFFSWNFFFLHQWLEKLLLLKNFFLSYLLSINIKENSIEKILCKQDSYESIAIASSWQHTPIEMSEH